MLDLAYAPETTAAVFNDLSRVPLMSGYVLVGGTALSIQLGHRLSEDLDFWLPMDKMSSPRVDAIVEAMRSAGHDVQLMTPAWQITQAKINGQDLLSLSRDYVINGVKVTFFARDDAPYRHFAGLERTPAPDISFEIMSADAIFEMKSWLISKRVRSRDLFDLMIILRDHDKSIGDILVAGQAADASFSPEYAKDVLLGHIPCDPEDEGFESIGLNVDLVDIYTYLTERVVEHEKEVARRIFRTALP